MNQNQAENTSQTSKILSLADSDPGFPCEVAAEPGGEGVLRCISCGTCTAGCPVRSVSEKYNPRKIIRLVLLGRKQEVLSSEFIWLCSTCYTCQERCPQQVRITDLMTALRNIAARNGHAPEAFRKQKDLILELGRLYEIDEFDNKKRLKANLPELTNQAEEIRTLYLSIQGDDR
jgi:heterodisulfide reductase subunit C2